MEDVEVRSSPAPGAVGDMELEAALAPVGDDAEMAPAATSGADVDFADGDLDMAMEGYDGEDQGTVGEEFEMGEEVEMGDVALEGEGDDQADEGELGGPPPFRSPPRVQTRDEEHQSQALGHTSKGEGLSQEGESEEEAETADGGGEAGAGDQEEDEREPDAGPSKSPKGDEANKHQSQLGDQALATQSQDDATDDQNGREQEQTIEDRSRNVQRLTQKQRQDRSGSETTKQFNEVNIRQRSSPDEGIEVSTNQRNSGPDHPSDGGPIEQVNVVNVMTSDDDCASNTASGAALARPRPAKHLIRAVSFGASLTKYFHHFRGRESHSPGVKHPSKEEEAPTQTEAERAAQDGERGKKPRLRAPPVLLTFDKTRYTLFCERDQADLEEGEAANAAAGATGDGGDDADELEDGGLLFPEPEDHGLYFNALESLCAKLHQEFRQFTTEGQEMVLVFEELGINVPEDNVYTRELSLYDLDRLHVGANLPGRLHVVVKTQPRLIRRFNILAGHVSKLLEDDSYDENDDVDPLDTASVAEALGDDETVGDAEVDEDEPGGGETVASNKVILHAEGTEVVEGGDGSLASVKRVVVTGHAQEGKVSGTSSKQTPADLPVAIPADKLAEVAEPVESNDAGAADTSTPSESLPNKSASQSVDATPPALSTRSHAAAKTEGPTTRKRSSEEAKEAGGEQVAAEGNDEAAKKKAKVE